jgi:DNA integrity scanning protein DisA with diadenylate cyclase activity
MYHVNCATCGRFLALTTDAHAASGVQHCVEHAAGETAVSPAASLASVPGLASDLVDLLTAAGYGSVTAVDAAGDDELLAVAGIGPARLRKIREVLDEMRD